MFSNVTTNTFKNVNEFHGRSKNPHIVIKVYNVVYTVCIEHNYICSYAMFDPKYPAFSNRRTSLLLYYNYYKLTSSSNITCIIGWCKYFIFDTDSTITIVPYWVQEISQIKTNLTLLRPNSPASLLDPLLD